MKGKVTGVVDKPKLFKNGFKTSSEVPVGESSQMKTERPPQSRNG